MSAFYSVVQWFVHGKTSDKRGVAFVHWRRIEVISYANISREFGGVENEYGEIYVTNSVMYHRQWWNYSSCVFIMAIIKFGVLFQQNTRGGWEVM